ncbi:hypothetical protein P5673_032820, partial [Acropora cervicornis]
KEEKGNPRQQREHLNSGLGRKVKEKNTHTHTHTHPPPGERKDSDFQLTSTAGRWL